MVGYPAGDKGLSGCGIYVGVEKMSVFSVGSCSSWLLANVRWVYVGRNFFEEME
jgi:hypothetical protein